MRRVRNVSDLLTPPEGRVLNSFKESELKEKDNIIPMKKPGLALIGGPDVPDENWLGIMEAGTAFLSREKNSDIKNPFCNQYEVAFKKGDFTLLFVNTPDNQTARPWVDNLRFCRRMELVTILGVAKEAPAPETKETTDVSNQADEGNASGSPEG